MKRGCGTRERGGIYVETKLSEKGSPLEDFIICPPREINPDDFGLSPIGGILFQGQKEKVHIMDWIGKSHYPYVADFVEEVRVMGSSRRIPKNTDFSLLGLGSMVFCVHEKASIIDPDIYYKDWSSQLEYQRCPQGKPGHDQPTRVHEMCSGIWWKDFEKPDLKMVGKDRVGMIMGMRKTGDLKYGPVQVRPEKSGVVYHPAIFMRLPITNIAVIHDPVSGSHREAMKKASKAKLPILLEVQ
jgi:hypothetical protein